MHRFLSSLFLRGNAVSDDGTTTHHSELKTSVQQFWVSSLLIALGILCQPHLTYAQMGKSIDLNGSSDYIQAPVGVYFSGDFTIEGWVYPRSYGNTNYTRFFDFGNGQGNGNILLHFGPGGNRFYSMVGTSSSWVDFPNSIPLNQWSHVAVTLLGTTATIYINGLPVASGTVLVPANVSRSNCFIGKSNWSGETTTNAKFDEVRIWNIARTQEQIQDNMNRTLTGTETGLQVYYNMENIAANGQSQTVPDVAAAGGTQNATTVGTTATPTVRALEITNAWATALDFDGTNDNVEFSNTGFSTAAGTVEFWVNPDVANSARTFFDMGQGEAFTIFTWSDGKIYFRAGGGASQFSIPYSQTGKWQHIALTWSGNGTTFRGYIDGVQVGTGTQGSAGLSGAVGYIGKSTAGNYPFDGRISEFRLWTTTRTAAQIASNMDVTVPTNSTGLLRYYRLSQGTANGINTSVTTATDLSSNAVNGTLVGFALTGTGSNWVSRTPVINTPTQTSVLGSTAILGANYATTISDLEERGLVFSTNNNPSLTNGRKTVSSGNTAGAYSAAATNLKGGTKYYYRGYAYGTTTLNYSSIDSFTTNYSNLGNALSFDASLNNHFYIGSGLGNNSANPILNTISNALTLEIWIKPRDYSLQRFLNRQDQLGYGWALEIASGGLYFSVNSNSNGGKVLNVPTSYIPLNQWTHVAAVYNGSQMILYINGVAIGTMAQSGTIYNGSMYAGVGNAGNVGGYYNGVMDELRIWNVVRTQTQIQANMDAPIASNSTGLICYFPFDQGVANAPNPSATIPIEVTNNLPVVYGGPFTMNGNTSNWVSHADVAFSPSTTSGNNALHFDGNDDYAYPAPSTGIWNTMGSTLTVEAWVNPESYSNNYGTASTIFAKDNGQGTYSYGLRYSGSNIEFYVNGGGSYTAVTIPASTTPLNQWSHIAGTYDGAQLRLYINGSLVSTVAKTGTLNNSALPMHFGVTPNTNWCFKGSIDELRIWNTTRTQSEIQSNMNTVAANSTGLIAYYPFNQGTANGTNTSITTVFDASPNGFNATLQNLALTGTTSNFIKPYYPSASNNALDFDGTNDFVQVPAGNYFGSGTFTIEGWVYPKTSSANMRLLDFGNGQSNNNILLSVTGNGNGYPNFQIYNGSGSILGTIASTVIVNQNQWSHIAVTVSGTTATMYVNGRLAGSVTLSSAVSNLSLANCYIGRSNWTGDAYYNGMIDEFRVWNVVRTQAEIQANANISISTGTPGLVLYYPFNQGIAAGNNTAITTSTNEGTANATATLNNFGRTSWTSNFVYGNGFFNSAPDGKPVITNIQAAQATFTSASSVSNSTSIQEQGFLYIAGTNIPTMTTGTKIAASSTVTGSFSATPTGLTENQLYTVRTYITTGAGTILSPTNSFTTSFCRILTDNISIIPTPTTAAITWTVGSTGATTYSWKVVNAGAGVNATAVAFGTTTSPSVNVANLTPGRDYDFYLLITGGCSTTTWSDARSFSTKMEWNNTLHFDGSNDHVVLGNVGVVNNLTNATTVEAWIRPTGISGIDMIVNKELSNNGLKLYLNNGIPTAQIFTTAQITATATSALTVNQWAHVAMVYNGVNVMLYVNGNLVATTAATGNLAANTGTMYLGRAVAGSYFQGMMDEVRVWNVARTQSQLRAGMPSMSVAANSAGLILAYNFDQGDANEINTTVTDLTDATSSNITGVLTGFALTGNTSNWIARTPQLAVTPSVSGITSNSAILNGNLLRAGTGTITQRGFVYVLGTATPTFDNGTRVTATGTSIGGYSALASGLVLNNTYTFRAYTLSNDGYRFSDPMSFNVNPCVTAPALSSITSSNLTATSITYSWAVIAPSYDWVVTQSGFGVGNPIASGSSTTGGVNITGLAIGTNYDFFLRSNCGSTISPWQGAITFQTLAVPTFTTVTPANDAYVDINWTLHPLPCLINNGTPYSQGIYVKVTDQNTSQTIYQEPISNLTPFIGAQQPTFPFVAGDSAQNFACIVNNTSNWSNFNNPNWTIETWVRGNINANNAVIFKANLTNDISIKITGTTIAIQRNATVTNFSTPFPLGKWKHLAFTYDGSTVALFIDGAKKEQKSIFGLDFGGGAATYTIAQNLVGLQMGEIRYWNRVRTDVEIADNRWVTAFNNLGQNNLLLHWRWNTNNAAPTDLATLYDGENNTATYTGTGVLPTLPYITTPDYTPIAGTYRHYVGPNQNKNYKLEVFQIGSGAAIPTCTNLTTTGSTIAFQQPINGSASTDSLNKIRLSWQNKSKLSESFKIFRNGSLRTVIAGSSKIDSVFVWDDIYDASDSSSIVNGTPYNYCVETYCNNLNMGFTPQLCMTGNTFDINLSASDNNPTNQVNLSWANVASYGYSIQVKREGVLLATLPATATSYADLFPIYGKTTKYEVVLYNSSTSAIIVSDVDNGSVPTRGIISGRAATLIDNYAIKNVRIKLHSLVDTTLHLTTYTDYQGNFSFNNLYYSNLGQFELTADYNNHIFVNHKQTISLSDAQYVIDNVLFQDSTGFTVNTTPLAVTNFAGTAMPTQDKVNLSWNYTTSAGDTVLYDIYRDATKIATLTSLNSALSFADLGGKPNVNYNYKINAYRYQGNTITAATMTSSVIFPAVTMTTGFTATPNTASGVVNMTWSHSSSNYSGFRIYRNGKKIADLAPNTLTYTDEDATPGTTATYVIKAKRFIDNITFESFGQTANNVAIPALPSVGTITATANNNRNSVIINWTIPATLPANYNYDGFRIYRKTSGGSDVYIGQLPKAINPPFEDKTGLPNVSYIYTVKAFLRLPDNTIGESNGASATRIYPVVTAPTAPLTTTTTLVGEVALTWTAPSSSIKNIDGQVVIRGTDTLTVLATNVGSYRVFTNSTTNATFSIRNFRIINGVRYFSNLISAAGKAAAGSTSPEFATNVKASQNLPNHVRISWDYPSYVLSTFNIYRDNVLVTTLPTESRVYIDNTAIAGTTHLYQIEAVNGSNISQKVGAWGSLKSIIELNGTVYSNTDKYGVPGVDVYLTGSGFTKRTQTDSSGFYVFSELPQTIGTSLTVSLEGYGTNHTATFVPSSQTFAITTAKVYTRNFGSTYTPATTDSIAPTRPMNITATPIPARRRMAVTWTTSNAFYDGFEVFRANVLLGTVMKGENFVVYDTEGYPGISYTYQIRSFQYKDNTQTAKKYSGFYSVTGVFPDLESPLYLTATPNLAVNTLKLTWSHNWDNHTYYEVLRNDSVLANINTGSVLEYTDNTGVPGQQYTYGVRSVMVVGGKTHYSTMATINVQYPSVAEVSNLTATSPTISTTYTAPCAINVSQERNFVDLGWSYNPNAVVKGFRVYREQTLLATLPANTLFYRDAAGIPANYQAYTVKTIIERQGVNYYSQGVTVNKTYPTLATIQQVTHNDSLGMKQIKWKYPDGGAEGFYILRNGVMIDTLAADSIRQTAFAYQDQTGVSGTAYNYGIRAYTRRNSVLYWSDTYTCLTNIVYPKPVTPSNVQASDGSYSSYVKVTWDYPQGTDITGFVVFKDGTQVGTVTGGLKTYIDLNTTTSANYSVRAYKSASFQGNAYTNNSDISVADAGYPSQTNAGTFPITSTVATKGTLNGQTRIDWGFPTASNGSISGFKVFRDGTLIQTANATDRYFYDANGVAGKRYVYEVCTYTNTGDNNRRADTGWSRPDGYMEGKVVTISGNGGVGGVAIKAVASIEGNDYIYNAITDVNGNYAMPDVYYGDAISNFTLTASFGDHVFLTNPIYTTLSPQQKTRNTLFFNDKTAYTISGVVARREVTCYLDSIHVWGEYIMSDSTREILPQDAYTTPDGAYSLNINPYKQNVIGLQIHIDSTRVLMGLNGGDTLRFRFAALQTSQFGSLAGLGQNTTLNFEDTLTYPVRLNVLTACRTAVTGGNFKIRVRSKDDCFDKVFTTDMNGFVTAKLPPLSYIMNVDGVGNNTTANQLVVDYLRYRPQTLDIYSLYIDTTYHASANVWDSLTKQEFVYHRPPSISVLSGFDKYLCDNPNNPAVIKQGENYSLRFQVSEIFNGSPCVSRTGYLVLKNAAATETRDTVYVNREQ